MKSVLCVIFAVCLLLCGCAARRNSLFTIPTLPQTPSVTEPATTETLPTVTEPAETEPTETEPLVTEPVETEPLHSALYLEGYNAYDVASFFCEIALTMEYGDGDGNFSVIQKWVDPIRYTIIGAPTEQDLSVLDGLFAEMNRIEGFPGIYKAEEYEYANLTFYFLNEEAFNTMFGEGIHHESADGAAQFWFYNDTNIIYEAKIGYRTDIDQEVRNSVLLEEVYNCMGLSDTSLRKDSIVYQGYSTPQALTDMDWLILKLLFHPEMERGMDLDACTDVIHRLYY